MEHFNKSRTMLWVMVLLSSLSTFAQNSMVGDGFGGRAGYDPINYRHNLNTAFAVCGANKQLYAWGDNSNMQFGTGSYTPVSSATPVAVPGMTNVRMFAGSYTNIAIKNDGTVWMWVQSSGAFYFSTPYQIGSNAYHASTYNYVASYVKTDGTVWSVGENRFGEFGNGTTYGGCTAPPCTPAQMTGITTAKRVASAAASTLVLLADGTLMQCGTGNGSFPASLTGLTPVVVPNVSNVVDIKASPIAFYALTASGQVYSWGLEDPTLGRGFSSGATPQMPGLITFPAGAAPIKALSSNFYTCMALDDNGNLYAWGQNFYGQFGNGTSGSIYKTPVLVATGVRDMSCGFTVNYMNKTDGTLWAAGNIDNTWMDLPNVQRTTWTQITPTGSPMNLCTPTSFIGMPPCVAGTTAPAVTPTTATNSCPTTTVNLASLAISSTTPSGASLIWSTHKTPTSAADTLTTAQKTAVSTAGKYYALYYDATNACYSPADSVTITLTTCIAPLTANTPAAQTATTGTAKTGNAATELAPTGGVSPYIYSNGAGNAACVAPSGATALTGLTVNANGSYSYTAPTTAGTYYYCIKVCDSATPTASCIVKTYTLTVSPPACTVTGITPTIIKN